MKSVVVLGMHRSGTSLLAGMLHRLGVHMGKPLLAPDRNNPFGYFENWEFVALNNIILYAANGTWDRPPLRDDILAVQPHFEMAIKAIIRQNKREPFWGFKDPRTCLTVELYHPHLRNPFYVVVKRNVNAIVKSLVEANGFSISYAKALTQIYLARIELFLKEYKPDYFVFEYEKAKESIEELADTLGLKLTDRALQLLKPRWKVKLAKRIAYWCDFVKGALKRM